MYTHCLPIKLDPAPPSLLCLPTGAPVPVTTPIIEYIEPCQPLEAIARLEKSWGQFTSRFRPTRRKECPQCSVRRRRKSFSTRARRQCRHELVRLEALPIVRRARAAGLHGAALRAYVSAVAALDGPEALEA
jgi:hypothetical protein